MARGDTILAPFEFYLDDFEESVPIQGGADLRWYYFRLLNHLWKYGAVADCDYEIAVKSGLKPVGNYRKTIAKLRTKLSPMPAETSPKPDGNTAETPPKHRQTGGSHSGKQGFLTQARLHEDREEYLKHRARKRKNQQDKRARDANVTGDNKVSHQPPLPTTPTPTIDSLNRESKRAEKNSSRKGTRLASDWSLPGEWREDARQMVGGCQIKIDVEAARFRDYWIAKPGQGGVKLDWRATWRNWIRNCVERMGGATESDEPVRSLAEIRAELESRRNQGRLI